MRKRKNNPARRGFSYFRTRDQILEYMKVPAKRKLQWLEEMFQFNRRLARSNPAIGRIQEKFRRGEI